jgi:hypothetical protein
VPNARPCLVSLTDTSGVQHSVEVVAGSLYEAAALAILEFRQCPYVEAEPGVGITLTITVKPPASSHQVRVGKLHSWLEGAGIIPVLTNI